MIAVLPAREVLLGDLDGGGVAVRPPYTLGNRGRLRSRPVAEALKEVVARPAPYFDLDVVPAFSHSRVGEVLRIGEAGRTGHRGRRQTRGAGAVEPDIEVGRRRVPFGHVDLYLLPGEQVHAKDVPVVRPRGERILEPGGCGHTRDVIVLGGECLPGSERHDSDQKQQSHAEGEHSSRRQCRCQRIHGEHPSVYGCSACPICVFVDSVTLTGPPRT